MTDQYTSTSPPRTSPAASRWSYARVTRTPAVNPVGIFRPAQTANELPTLGRARRCKSVAPITDLLQSPPNVELLSAIHALEQPKWIPERHEWRRQRNCSIPAENGAEYTTGWSGSGRI